MMLSDKGNLLIWAVYDHPRDFPDCYVARAFEVDGVHPDGVVTGKVIACTDLDELRHGLELLGLVKYLDRDPDDQPHIIETWI